MAPSCAAACAHMHSLIRHQESPGQASSLSASEVVTPATVARLCQHQVGSGGLSVAREKIGMTECTGSGQRSATY